MKLNYHRNMVRKSLTRAGFGPDCIKCAIKGNKKQDAVPRGQIHTAYHMDGCDFAGGAKLIQAQWKNIEELLEDDCEENLCAIMEAWGRLSHAVQDFYSHSNWVDMGNKLLWDLNPKSLPKKIKSGVFVLSGFKCRQNGKACPTHAVFFHAHDDLSKDKPDRPNFIRAYRLAYKHTKKLAIELRDKIPSECLKACG